ncbi:MAG: DUF3488 and transglutaminase-like domain-containing protein [Litorilituus sp.]|nr:DUF3488 and transglutaminase-like domain-containing protein [Litorilituus sp.]
MTTTAKLPISLIVFMAFNTLLSLISLPLSFIPMLTLLVLTAVFYLYKQHTKQDNQHIKSINLAQIVAYILVFACLALIWQNLEVPSLIAIAAALTALSWAKAGELTTNRDRHFIWLLSTSLLAIQLLLVAQYQSIIAIIGLLLIFSSAAALQQNGGKTLLSQANKRLTTCISTLLITSLPLALILFVTLPRINLPMQELGLAMGLPISIEPEKNLAEKGLGKELGFDDIGEQGQSDSRVLLASLPSDFVQNSEQPLYWRGPVYWRYSVTGTGDNSKEKWQLREGFTNRSKRQYNGFGSNQALTNMTSMRDNTLEYSVILMPHGEYWLYGLDLPAKLTGESYLSQDYQLLSIRTVDTMWRYKIKSSLSYQISEKEPQAQLDLGLTYPVNNPKIKALGQQWQQQYSHNPHSALAIIAHAEQFFKQGQFLYANTNESYQGQHQLDQFLFTRKVGYSQHYASALTLLLRAAGIPARLVAGYRGAEKIGLTNMYAVNEHHAHAWLEAFVTNEQGQQYWQRIDPSLWLSDMFFSNNQQQAEIEKQTAQSKEAASTPLVSKQKNSQQTNTKKSSSWLDTLNQWTLEFDAKKQNELAKKLGITQLLWWHLLLIALALLFALAIAIYLVLRFINRPPPMPEHVKAYQKLCSKLAQQGVAKLPHEGAQTYLTRCANHANNTMVTAQINGLLDLYLLLAYSPLTNQQSQKLLKQFTRLIAKT